MCAPQSGPLRDVHGVMQRREGKRELGDRGGQDDKGVNQKERDRYQSRKRNKRNPNWKRRSKTLTVCR